MTQRFTLGIQGRGQNPEKNDVIKSTDIFERDSLVPGQEPKLREDLTITMEPNPAGTSQASQIQTTNTDDIMNHSVSLENHLWGTSLSLEAAVDSLVKTTDEFQQLKFARESHGDSLNGQFAFESIGERIKAGIKKVIEYIRAFFKRMMDWVKGERGQAAKAKVEAAKEAVKSPLDEKTLDEVLDQVYKEMFGEDPKDASRNPFTQANNAGSFKKAADEASDEVQKSFDDMIKQAEQIMKSKNSSDRIAEMIQNAERVSEALDRAYEAAKGGNSKFVNEVSRENVNKFYRQFRDWYGKQASVIVDENGELMAVKPASLDDIAAFIEQNDVEPEVGNALAQALRAAAKVAKFQEDRVKAEATTAAAVLSIEDKTKKSGETEGVSKENLAEPGSVDDGQDDSVTTGEGAAEPTATEGEGGLPDQTAGDQADISLNAPEYLEGENETMAEEETQEVIEARAEDLAVAAEALVAQTRVLNKLKTNRVISVGFVTESIQTLGENPFKDPRYYTQLPSRTNYDYSVESLGQKIKDGAKSLIEKIKGWIARVWQWVKSHLPGRKKKLEEVKANAKAVKEETAAAFKEAKEKAPEQFDKPFEDIPEMKSVLESAPEPKKPVLTPEDKPAAEQPAAPPVSPEQPAKAIYQLLGLWSEQHSAHSVIEMDRQARHNIESNKALDTAVAELERAVKAKNLAEAQRIANEFYDTVAESNDQRRNYHVKTATANQELIRLMASEPKASSLQKVAEILATLEEDCFAMMDLMVESNHQPENLGKLAALVDSIPEEGSADYAEAISKVLRGVNKHIKIFNVDFDKDIQTFHRDLPVQEAQKYAKIYMQKLMGSIAKGEVPYSNESLRRIGGNPFDGSDIASWASFGLEAETLGSRFKEGAKELKDKLVALFKRVIEWIKNLLGRSKQNAEAIKAKVEAANAKADQAFESVKQSFPDAVQTPLGELEQTKSVVANPPQPKPLTPTEKNGDTPDKPATADHVYQLFGHYMSTSMGIYVLEYRQAMESYRSAYSEYAAVVAEIGKAVKGNDVNKLHAVVDAYEAAVGKETEAFDSFQVDSSKSDPQLKQLMEKTPSVAALEEVHQRVRTVYDGLLSESVKILQSDSSDSSVAAMSGLISEFMGSNHDLELLGRVTRTFTKWQSKVRTRYESFASSASTQIPVYHTYQILQRFKAGSDDTGPANESLRKPARRKPYWERPGKN